MIKPISPQEIKKKELPDSVIIAFNELLQEKYHNEKTITILQKDAVAKIISVSGRSDYRSMVSAQAIFDNHWLDIEDIYRDHGWKVEYDKPGYNEDYEAYFKFNKK